MMTKPNSNMIVEKKTLPGGFTYVDARIVIPAPETKLDREQGGAIDEAEDDE